ncbi:glycosyltransferase family 4 protein [Epilithonimonas hungarica]|uniref:Glycosyltransferase involved in cell wall bisynthesis n=1 Tax=Epilithonimonas hungarica TaxID=454006 RepID=A0A1G7GHR9_9FLAO|nr:glycosyltransferase family 4 protein [Epilithonimonas hungarica]SDE87677.1 Glycosyltransferase involved in cell wall bisynthesis [Epilithonimonas hungarica]
MKIAVLLTRIDQTGMSINTIDLCVSLSKLGHSVDLLVGDYNNSSKKLFFQKDLLKTSEVNVINIKFSHRSELLSKFFKVLGVLKIILFLIFKNYDVIHVESPYLSFIPWLIRKKFVSTMHVPDLENIFAYKNATRVIAISKETKEYCVDKFGYKENQIDLVYHGVNERFYQPISANEEKTMKQNYGISQNDILIGLVASIERRKGQDILINAIENLNQEIRRKVKLVLLGSYKSGSNGWLENLINSSSISNQIIWEQYQDPKPFYNIIDIFVLPSRLEGFPLVSLEAMLSGCLVIRSNTEGSHEQIIDGLNGFLFENENSTELTKILSYILENESLLVNMRNFSKTYAFKNFTQAVMAKNTLKVYEKLKNIKL